MQILSYDEFRDKHYNPDQIDNITAIYIKRNDVCLEGWLEDSPDYNIKQTRRYVSRPLMEFTKIHTLTEFFENSIGYQQPLSTVCRQVSDPLEQLYEDTGENAAMIVLSQDELYDVLQILKDGYYILSVTNTP